MVLSQEHQRLLHDPCQVAQSLWDETAPSNVIGNGTGESISITTETTHLQSARILQSYRSVLSSQGMTKPTSQILLADTGYRSTVHVSYFDIQS
jgi:hypothetical protein